jgi:hypothetical protein
VSITPAAYSASDWCSSISFGPHVFAALRDQAQVGIGTRTTAALDDAVQNIDDTMSDLRQTLQLLDAATPEFRL